MRLYGRIRLGRHLGLFAGVGPGVITVAGLVLLALWIAQRCGAAG